MLAFHGKSSQDLFGRYDDASEAPVAPERPDWCFEEGDDGVDDDGNAMDDSGVGSSINGDNHRQGGGGRRRRELHKKDPKFMDGVPGVTAVTEQPLLGEIQRRIQDICGWNK